MRTKTARGDFNTFSQWDSVRALPSARGCSEPFCNGKFPGETPCGYCYWTCTPCGVCSSIVFPIVGLVCCCVPNCQVCGYHCNKVPKRDQAPKRRFLFGIIPMGRENEYAQTGTRKQWHGLY